MIENNRRSVTEHINPYYFKKTLKTNHINLRKLPHSTHSDHVVTHLQLMPYPSYGILDSTL